MSSREIGAIPSDPAELTKFDYLTVLSISLTTAWIPFSLILLPPESSNVISGIRAMAPLFLTSLILFLQESIEDAEGTKTAWQNLTSCIGTFRFKD